MKLGHNITGTRSNEDLNITASGTGNIVVGALRINGTTVSSDDSSAINFAEGNRIYFRDTFD